MVGVAAALLCVWLNTPLPWIIGPLFGTAALRLAGVHLHSPVRVREAGQWAIGTALGLTSRRRCWPCWRHAPGISRWR
ncbi:AbrB family transcriptional regulator [Pseudoduganella sp. UC29_106]|uniref:AbrB family transcriptional regulator n=1 Tax=Pseudoduganella sp. UC29_106 TaxID=3374553 RepID=UPI003757C439